MFRRMFRIVPFAVFCGSAVAIAGADGKDSVPELNQKVLAFATSNLGKQVGNGECWTLADEALAAAGAQRPHQGGYGALEFGRELKPNESLLPGDVLQFTKTKLVSKSGSWVEMALHTAIVAGVKGTKVDVLHQNWSDQRRVTRFRFDLSELTEGKVQRFRPQLARE